MFRSVPLSALESDDVSRNCTREFPRPSQVSTTFTMTDIQDNFAKQLFGKYATAQDDEHLVFNGKSAVNESIVAHSGDSEYLFDLTELQSLEHRPEIGTIDKNPFEKPEPELTVLSSFGNKDEFRIVLNKFPVVPAHFMMVTKQFKSQDTPLSPSELTSTYLLLHKLEAQDLNKKWFAFYNCGPQSGASQPHKHVQFMPLPDNYTPFAEVLANTSGHFIPNQFQEPLQDGNLPFAHFLAKLPEKSTELDEETLALTFLSLLQRTLTVLRDNEAGHISYNVIATTKFIMLIPRSKAKFQGSLGINSCGYMGLILCKNASLVGLVKSEGPLEILSSVGFPSTAGQKSDEYHY